MMDYLAIREDTVIPLIKEFGKSAMLLVGYDESVWTRSFDVATQRIMWTRVAAPHDIVYVDPGLTPTLVQVYVVERTYDTIEIDGKNVKTGDRRFIVAGASSMRRDYRLCLGEAYDEAESMSIESFIAKQPGPITLFYTVQCRE